MSEAETPEHEVNNLSHKLVAINYPEGYGYDNTRKWFTLTHLPLWIYWAVYDTVHRMGNAIDASFLVTFGFFIDPASEMTGADLDEAQNAIIWLLDGLAELQPLGVADTAEERLLRFTYSLLRRKQLNHTEAAAWASIVLGIVIKPDAWRKRIERYRESKELPPIEAQRGRPKKIGRFSAETSE